MRSIHVDTGVADALAAFEMPQRLGFGVLMAPVMYRCQYQDGRWWDAELMPYGPLQIDPAAKVLHYAQEIFEGLKAYRVDRDRAALFRPQMNWERMNLSARRLCMPDIPRDIFMQAVQTVTAYCEDFIPRNSGQSLYLRPFMFGTQPDLSVAAANSYSFLVIASPSEVYHSGSMRVLVERNDSRAAVGGTGAEKVGGNYAASLQSVQATLAKGFDQTLWLHPSDRRHIEELSGMNFFAVMEGELHTPALSGSILPGVTRDSLIQLARALDITVHERPMDIDDLLALIKSGTCTEAFACGTATIVSPISVLGDADGQVYELPDTPGPVARQLRQALLDIQEGRGSDRFDWMSPIPPECYP
ncbi:branched-chain amino acid aminotransferase [Exilibacterium tricleocarpae]|uniref:Branched-chain-amino-acid aminotransferase n=1 Tax=Exilibacterium tricleocarpae TaxID=2591008 RepID=A0A545U589_9GAMM|nr:branched-chain amino acid aminotransferase [Exilibacterium tricleocarpae]TQV84627.1 branched-chain amino acid aminotransferase [Exilibacterium tricleocarpae]